MTATMRQTIPRVLLGCLVCLDEGKHQSAWVPGTDARSPERADLGTEDLMYDRSTGRMELHVRCNICGDAAFGVLDYDGYGPFLDAETTPQEAALVAEDIEFVLRDGKPPAALYTYGEAVGPEEALDRFEDAYIGAAPVPGFDDVPRREAQMVAEFLDALEAILETPKLVERMFSQQFLALGDVTGGDQVFVFHRTEEKR